MIEWHRHYVWRMWRLKHSGDTWHFFSCQRFLLSVNYSGAQLELKLIPRDLFDESNELSKLWTRLFLFEFERVRFLKVILVDMSWKWTVYLRQWQYVISILLWLRVIWSDLMNLKCNALLFIHRSIFVHI